eukprot:GGOE01024127.1.p1 GENE.GGOE01024127.1~~GGOE01024127.1.p1  ORF type:complete len:328 (-),score=46.18 GGOE01024127.1:341-1276(-)
MAQKEHASLQERLRSLEAEQAKHERAMQEAKEKEEAEEKLRNEEGRLVCERCEVHQRRQERDLHVIEQGIRHAVQALEEEDNLVARYRYKQLMDNYNGACGRGPRNWKIAAYATDVIALTEASKDAMKKDLGKLKHLLQALEDEEWEWEREGKVQGEDGCQTQSIDVPQSCLQKSAPVYLEQEMTSKSVGASISGSLPRKPPTSLTRDVQRLRATLDMLEEEHNTMEAERLQQQEFEWQDSEENARYLDMSRHRAANRRSSEWSLQRHAAEEAQQRELERSAGRSPSPPHDSPAKPEPHAAIMVMQELVAF